MTQSNLELGRRSTADMLGELVLDTRRLICWTQLELAARAGTSQSTVSRIESGRAASIDFGTIGTVLDALGLRARVEVEGRHLDDRRRQRDAVHARLTGYVARRLERTGWLTATEVAIGEGIPRGWIDLLTFRPADRALLIEESKTDLPDLGGLQRSLAFYEREARAAAHRLGWYPRSAVVLLVALDTEVMARRLADNRDLVTRAFPAPVSEAAAWLASPGHATPRGWVIGTCDPASRRTAWLRPTTLGSRRRTPAYADYADAAAQLVRGAPPRR